MIETRKTFCRFCHANCAIEVDVEDGRPVAVRGDTSDPVFGGYTCMKGRELPRQTLHPDRLLVSQKRLPDGRFAPIATEAALDEIAARLAAIRDRHGARAIATYNGSYAFQNSAALAVAWGFQKGLGSPGYYTSVTVDQPAKVYMPSRVGTWLGGSHSFSNSDVLLMIGNNPLVSHYAPPGSLPPFSPSRRLRDAKARGLKLICVDPRRTMVAALADIHLQLRPGEDATLLAGLLNVILSEQRHDRAFCERYVEGLEVLRAAVAPFTPDYVAQRADVGAQDLIAAARLFAQGPRGIAATGTGPEFAPHSTLTEHLVEALNIVCGRFCRDGEISPVPRVLSPAAPRKAQVQPPAPQWGEGFPKARVRGLTALGEEMPTTTLADEILLPGEGQIRALLCIGGNPLIAWPNQIKVQRALAALDLLVCVDIKMSQTAKLAHYVVAPQVSLERDDITILSEWWFEEPYARYTGAVLEPPPGTLDEWEFFWELARRLGTEIPTAGGPLPMDRRPSKFEVLEKITQGCRVPLARVREETLGGGKFFPEAEVRVEPADAGADARFQLAPAGVTDELRALHSESLAASGEVQRGEWSATHLLICRRSRNYYNSTGHDLAALRRKGVTNFAYLNAADLAGLGVNEGDLVEIAAAHASILGVVRATDEVKPGVVSMSHAFGDDRVDAAAVLARGAPTNRLVNDEVEYDPITGQTRQTAIRVRVRRHEH